MVESGKVSSAKWTLFLFMAVIVATIVLLAKYDSLRQLLGLDTALEAIWIGVVILAFFCMPTFLGLLLASSRADKTLSKINNKDAA
jgi:glycerol-3-phosphate acyltransferase PlsY